MNSFQYGVPIVSHLSEVPRTSLFPPPADESITVIEAQDLIRALMDGRGSVCPCCGRLVRFSSIPLGTGKARTMIRMFKRHQRLGVQWIHMIHDVNNFGLPSRDYGSCAYWGLTERMEGGKDDGNPDSGFWRLTNKGRAFVMGLVRCPYRAVVWNTRLIAMSEEDTDIHKSLGKKFIYAEEIAKDW